MSKSKSKKTKSYINQSVGLRTRVKLEKDISKLSELKSQLYGILVPLELIQPTIEEEENEPEKLNGFLIWHEDKLAELPNSWHMDTPLSEQITFYSKVIDRLTNIKYNSLSRSEVEQSRVQLKLESVY